MKTLKTLLLVALVLGAASSLYAQRNQPRRPMQEQRDGLDRLFQRLPDLTGEQKEQIRALQLKNREAMLPIANELNEKRARLRTLTTGDNPDLKAADRVIEEIGALHTERMKNWLSHRMAIRELLTEEQRIVFDTLTGPATGGRGMRSMQRRPGMRQK